MRLLLWWLLAIVLAPVWFLQALYVRRTALRLPEAQGPQEGQTGTGFSGPEYVLHVIGESTVAGVGVSRQAQGLVAAMAANLAEQLQRPVRWRAFGRNGIRLQGARRRLIPEATVTPANALVWVFGVNDTTGLTPLRRWRSSIREATILCRARNMTCMFTGVPPMEHFTALPSPLRQVLAARARLLDASLREELGRTKAHYCTIDLRFSAEYLAADGYHPSEMGYQLWGREVARQLRALAP